MNFFPLLPGNTSGAHFPASCAGGGGHMTEFEPVERGQKWYVPLLKWGMLVKQNHVPQPAPELLSIHTPVFSHMQSQMAHEHNPHTTSNSLVTCNFCYTPESNSESGIAGYNPYQVWISFLTIQHPTGWSNEGSPLLPSSSEIFKSVTSNASFLFTHFCIIRPLGGQKATVFGKVR